MEEYDIPDELRDVIFRARVLLLLFAPLFSLFPLILSRNSAWVQVGLGLTFFFLSFLLCVYLVLMPAENMQAWIELRNPLKRIVSKKPVKKRTFQTTIFIVYSPRRWWLFTSKRCSLGSIIDVEYSYRRINLQFLSAWMILRNQCFYILYAISRLFSNFPHISNFPFS